MAPFQAQLSYQVCPIVLTGGSAAQIPGGMLPLISLFAMSSEVNALGLPFDIGDLDDAFGAFNVLPGGTLVSQSIAKYPFANQDVAANAVIREPLTLSVIMDAPMRGGNAWQIKQTVFTALKGTLDKHNQSGGTYTVATPAYIYDSMIMTSLSDNSRGNNSLPQNAWRFDFERPLSALADLTGAMNLFMNKINQQLPVGGQPTGVQVGSSTGNLPTVMTIKSAGGLSPSTLGSGHRNLSQDFFNYPAIPNPANFPFKGVS